MVLRVCGAVVHHHREVVGAEEELEHQRVERVQKVRARGGKCDFVREGEGWGAYDAADDAEVLVEKAQVEQAGDLGEGEKKEVSSFGKFLA